MNSNYKYVIFLTTWGSGDVTGHVTIRLAIYGLLWIWSWSVESHGITTKYVYLRPYTQTLSSFTYFQFQLKVHFRHSCLNISGTKRAFAIQFDVDQVLELAT